MSRHTNNNDPQNMATLAAELEARNQFRGAGPQDTDEQIHALSTFEIPTLLQFVKAAQTGHFPGNRDVDLPLWPKEEMRNFSRKYAEWAPPPYSELPQPAGPFGLGPIPGVSPPAIIRVMHVMSGMADLFTMAASKDLGRSQKLLKTKIWFGLPPLSEAHWATRRLDDESNIEETLAILQSVVDVFDHLRQPQIQGELRDKHNKIFVEMDTFQDACNALRSSRGEPVPSWSLGKLWLQYVRCHFDFIESQARAWMFKHLPVLHDFWKARFMAAFTNGRVISSTHGTVRVDHFALFILNKIQDLYLNIDIIMRCRPDGFIIPGGVAGSDPRLCQIDAPSNVLNEFYRQTESKRMRDMKFAFAAALDEYAQARAALSANEPPYPEFMQPIIRTINREFMHKEQQPHIENPPPFGMESWVRDLGQKDIEQFGFVIYRLSYKETDEEWEALRTQLEKAIDDGWEGVVGAEKIKHKAVLHWIDGRDENVKIPEGDLQAARRNFKTLSESPSPPPTGVATTLCLAVTSLSLSSLKEPQKPNPSATTNTASTLASHPGNFGPFLHAIDTSFSESTSAESSSSTSGDPDPRTTARQNSQEHPPGYDGTLKIASHLLYNDLYALYIGIGGAVTIENMWSLSVKHPWGIYVGPSTGVLRRNWRNMIGLGGIAVSNAGRIGALGVM
ncbi:uncharacterized protein BP5553_08310 [Venustampulla echinocandica]|uniref:Uncharacterized protein n=1 Tax=Venustampulla echinocandica TaxID=2656787 RepID=A0A370TGC0_9HELO|nr:uncharacterized protein BP5553_08310 [Venustampulla echinocandica]RDL33942.1 hypothetical protein BP5553_08310 [Venustampulla echinocandica]